MSWKTVSIGEITKVVTKGTTPKIFLDSGVNYIKAEALNGDSSLNSKGFYFIDEQTHESLRRSQLDDGDVLLTIAGAQIGKCGYVKDSYLPANTNQAVGIMRPDKNKAVPKFIYYFFKQKKIFQLIQGLNSQAAQPNINLTMLKQIKLQIPKYAIQQKITSTLSAYDDLIENNRRRIQLLEESARLLYREWFVNFRFPGHEKTKIVDGVPEGWERKTLKNLTKSVSYGYTASSTPEPIGPKFLRITDIVPNIIDWNTVPYCDADEKTIDKFKLLEGDIVVARTGATVGYAKRIGKLQSNAIYASYLVCLRFSDLYDNILAGVYMESEDYKSYIRNNAGGAAQPNANAKIIAGATVLVPKRIIQKEFRNIVEPAIQQREVLQQQNQKLAEARDLLLPRMMNGEIEV